jgi:hypothetical protein
MVQEISLLNMQAVEARLNSENPTELPDGDSLAPHVDRPLQRAIEFMQQYIGNSMKAI